MSSTKGFKVGIICGSTRSPRVGPQITQFVHDTIQSHRDAQANNSRDTIQLDIVDIADFNLPLFDEPGIPQAITDPSNYAHQHTRDWSARVSSFDAFVLVTPQYNWGIPAALKNALDFLFNEWKGKPAMVVSYGGHGGGHAAAALKTVCQGLRMQVVERTVNLTFPDGEFKNRCVSGKDLGLQAEDNEKWVKEKEGIVAGWEGLVAKLIVTALR